MLLLLNFTEQKLKFSIKDFFNKLDKIRRELLIWSHLLKKSLMENFIFCAVFEHVSVCWVKQGVFTQLYRNVVNT